MPDLMRTIQRGVFATSRSFYVRGADRKWKRFKTIDEAVAFRDERTPPRGPAVLAEEAGWLTPGWVYFVAPVGGGPVKIGWSVRIPEQRLVEMQCGSPVPLEVVGRRYGIRDDERLLHELLADHRMHGEWFAPVPEVLHEASLTTSPSADLRGAV